MKRRIRKSAIARKLSSQGHDPVIAIAPEIHNRADKLTGPKMFDLVDPLPIFSEDWDGAAHECGMALRDEAATPQFAKANESTWNITQDEYTMRWSRGKSPVSHTNHRRTPAPIRTRIFSQDEFVKFYSHR